ncbi:MAG: RDD family protein [Caldilineaceae bacterium SB0662_bin_9]|uniref:RDD family protein n=1 Tax=Caldilineaceae bacterium SB0662_bin_9 TaxID=2605258 RepID=A0A6B1DUB2_9CHLR|nr:RDD family protein [Caldilineaceae bacterium SB0662_bin_9]
MNADLYPPPACLGLRVIAYCLDIGVGILHAMIWSYTGTFMFMVRAWWPLAVSAVLSLLIMGAWFILAARGRTIGKVFVGLPVILIDGNGNHWPPGIPRMLARAVGFRCGNGFAGFPGPLVGSIGSQRLSNNRGSGAQQPCGRNPAWC